MQLVEQGKLDLNADVNRYIDFQIPSTYPQPITLQHLMTHTAGFEDDPRELIGDDPAQMRSMADWLPRRMPGRVRPPGTYAAYSNWATALAGYIIQRVSGESFEEYLEKHILEPLGMTHTSTRQPLPPALSSGMSQGYEWKEGRYLPHKWEILIGAVPAGSITSTATDMARFMIAHLQDGRLGDQRILAETTARRMHARVFGHDPRLPGFALGFYEKDSHGLHIIGHGGDSQWFHTDLALVPSESLGVFVSYNTDTGGSLSFGIAAGFRAGRCQVCRRVSIDSHLLHHFHEGA
jgi:CubicO group peptidase (beta-lactamase class C family)